MVTMTPDLLRHLRRIGLFAGFGLLVFVVALYMSFPYERAKEAAIRMASKNLDMDVEIGSAGPAFMAVVFRDIRVRTRPSDGQADALHDRFGQVLAFDPGPVHLVVPVHAHDGRAGRQDRARSVGHAGQEGRLPHRALRARHRHGGDPGGEGSDQHAADRQAEAGAGARVRDRPLRRRERLHDDHLRGVRRRRRQDAAQGRGQRVPVRRTDVAAHAHRRSGRARRGREGDREAAGCRIEITRRRGGAGGRDQPPRSAVVVDREPLPSFQAVRRVPPEGEQRPDDPGRGGSGGEAPGRFLRPSHRREPRPDDAARADADLAGGEQRGARARQHAPRRDRAGGAVGGRPAAAAAAAPPRRLRHAGGAGATTAAAAPAAARGGAAAPAPGPPPGADPADWKGAPPPPAPPPAAPAPAADAPAPAPACPTWRGAAGPPNSPRRRVRGRSASPSRRRWSGRRGGRVRRAAGCRRAGAAPTRTRGAGSRRTCARRGGSRRRATAARRAARRPPVAAPSLPSASRNADDCGSSSAAASMRPSARGAVRMAARRMVLRSSRTLPGNTAVASAASADASRCRSPISPQISRRKCPASNGISPRRSRSGGIRTQNPASR